MLALILLLLLTSSSRIGYTSESLTCPHKCYCENSETVSCEGANFEQIPILWRTIRALRVKNSSLLTIQKGVFKRYTHLEELVIESCDRLHAIEKFAFKGLNHLKLLRLANNPSLSDIAKNAFSQISNRRGLRIQLVNNNFTRIRQGSFRQLSHLREFTLEGRNLRIGVNAFVGLTQVDFFHLFGVISFGSRPFENVSRVHRLEISHSNFSISAGVFTAISHVREIYITSNDIDTISAGAFTGLYTIGCLTISDNRIGSISGHAFSSVVNIGEIIIERNNIRHLETEALLSEAWRTRFRDNILYCSCVINWLTQINDSVLLKRNFCGAEESHRSLSNYKPNCQRSGRGRSSRQTVYFATIFSLFISTFFMPNRFDFFPTSFV